MFIKAKQVQMSLKNCEPKLLNRMANAQGEIAQRASLHKVRVIQSQQRQRKGSGM